MQNAYKKAGALKRVPFFVQPTTITNTRWINTDYIEEKCEEFILLSERKPQKAARKIWPLLVVPSGLLVIR